MQDFAGSTVVHYQGALAGLAGALLLGPRIGKFAADGKPNAIPGHNMAFTTLGVIILWFGWFGFNPGSTLSVDFGGVGFFAYVALNTNLAAAAGVIGAVVTSWLVIKKPDLSMMLNGAIAALVAITAACAFVAPWAAIVIGFVAGVIVVFGVLFVERIGIDDPVGALSAHGMAGVWGTLSLGFFTVPALAGEARDRQRRPVLRRRAAPARHPGARPGRRRRVHVRRVVRHPLALQGHDRDPHRGGRRDRRPGRLRARHVGLSRVLHPGSRRLRHRDARPPGRLRTPRARRPPSTSECAGDRARADRLGPQTEAGRGAFGRCLPASDLLRQETEKVTVTLAVVCCVPGSIGVDSAIALSAAANGSG